jgi:LacI family transcriptional regulator
LLRPDLDEINGALQRIESARFAGVLSLHYGVLNSAAPTIYIDESSPGHNESFNILSDSYGGGRMITEKVLSLGRRDIVHISKCHNNQWVDLRRRGVIDTLKKHGVNDADSRCFVYNDTTVHHCTLALRQMLARYPGLTVIICNTDYVAFNVITAGGGIGLDIPGKISVTGYGNVREIRRLCNLTTVNQHPFELGSRACEKLIEITEGRHIADKVDTLAVELINGESLRKL